MVKRIDIWLVVQLEINMHDVLFWMLYNPLTVLLFVIGLGIANLWRKRREGRMHLWVVTVPFVLLCLISLPAIPYMLRGLLEWQYPPLAKRPTDIQAIVVLSSSLDPDGHSRTGYVLDEKSRRRCERAIEMYSHGDHCPIIVSGGRAASDQPSRATVMREFLIANGVSEGDIIVEDRSLDTYENARECQRILNERKLTKVLLVTDAIHMLRADRCFRKLGITTLGCGSYYRSKPGDYAVMAFLPHPKAIELFPPVGYELCAVSWYWIRGRI